MPISLTVLHCPKHVPNPHPIFVVGVLFVEKTGVVAVLECWIKRITTVRILRSLSFVFFQLLE